jgi:hypothetical protein
MEEPMVQSPAAGMALTERVKWDLTLSLALCEMQSVFASAEKRRELLYALLRGGFQVRMHSYEYFIRRGKFVSMVVLNPTWNLARIRLVRWNLEESIRAAKEIEMVLRGLDPGVRIEVV